MSVSEFALSSSLILITLPVEMILAFYLLTKIIVTVFKTSLYSKTTFGKKNYKGLQTFMKSPSPPIYIGVNIIPKG